MDKKVKYEAPDPRSHLEFAHVKAASGAETESSPGKVTIKHRHFGDALHRFARSGARNAEQKLAHESELQTLPRQAHPLVACGKGTILFFLRFHRARPFCRFSGDSIESLDVAFLVRGPPPPIAKTQKSQLHLVMIAAKLKTCRAEARVMSMQ